MLWALAIAWLPALVVTEALRPRPEYDVRRWSTVLPVGMYAACSFLVATAVHAPAITDFARAWVWVGVSVWLVVFIGMLRRGVRLATGELDAISQERIAEIAPSRPHSPERP